MAALVELPSKEEVSAAIKKLKANKAAGEDGIVPELWIHGLSELIDPLHSLICSIWSNETIPDAWTIATIVPLHKKGIKAECKNYRGISLLDIVSKIVENIILGRIRPDREVRTRENQAGFRPGRGCVDQIFCLRQILETRREYQQPTVVVFIDFKAAFDSVFRESLWKILETDGMPPKILNLIKSLYNNTRACVKHKGQLSEEFPVSFRGQARRPDLTYHLQCGCGLGSPLGTPNPAKTRSDLSESYSQESVQCSMLPMQMTLPSSHPTLMQLRRWSKLSRNTLGILDCRSVPQRAKPWKRRGSRDPSALVPVCWRMWTSSSTSVHAYHRMAS